MESFSTYTLSAACMCLKKTLSVSLKQESEKNQLESMIIRNEGWRNVWMNYRSELSIDNVK